MEDLVKAAQALLTYIEEEDVFDILNDDGDNYTVGTRSWEFKDLIEDLQNAIANPAPTVRALIKKCFAQTDEEATAEYVRARNLEPQPKMEYHSEFGYEEKPPFGWGQ